MSLAIQIELTKYSDIGSLVKSARIDTNADFSKSVVPMPDGTELHIIPGSLGPLPLPQKPEEPSPGVLSAYKHKPIEYTGTNVNVKA